MMPCYFVTGNDAAGFCRVAGHYLAQNPQEAINLLKEAQDANPHVDATWAAGLTFKARRSAARHNALNGG